MGRSRLLGVSLAFCYIPRISEKRLKAWGISDAMDAKSLFWQDRKNVRFAESQQRDSMSLLEF